MDAHRYWRLLVLANRGGWTEVRLGGIELRETPGGPNLSVSGNGTPSASSASSFPASNAFFLSQDPGYYWQSTSPDGPPTAWIKWDFGAGNAKAIRNLVLYAAGDTAYGYDITDFVFQHSDDNSTWTDALNGTQSQSRPAVAQSFTIFDTVRYDFSGVAPMGSLAFYGGINAAVVAPKPLLAFFGGSSIIATAPRPLLSMTARPTAGENALEVVAPMGILRAFTGASAKIGPPSPTLTSSLTVTSLLSAGLSAPSAKLAAVATAPNVLAAALSPKIGQIRAFTGAFAKLTAPSSPILSASVTAGSVLRATVMAPLFDLQATASRQNSLSARLLAPMGRLLPGAVARLTAPMGQLTAIGSAVITVTYEAYALNLKHNAETTDELTRYTNFPFDRIVRYENSYYGMNSTGLYLLEGDTDFAEPAPTPIPWSWKTTMTDFGTTQLQTVRWAYFGGRMAPAAQIAIHFGDTASESYAYSTPRDTSAQNYRQEFGRGIKSRYYAFSGQGSGELSLDSINFIIAKSARKV